MSTTIGCSEAIAGNVGVRELDEKFGRVEGMASQYGNLGNVMKVRGDLNAARELWTKARDLFARLGAQHNVDKVQGLIDELPV